MSNILESQINHTTSNGVFMLEERTVSIDPCISGLSPEGGAIAAPDKHFQCNSSHKTVRFSSVKIISNNEKILHNFQSETHEEIMTIEEFEIQRRRKDIDKFYESSCVKSLIPRARLKCGSIQSQTEEYEFDDDSDDDECYDSDDGYDMDEYSKELRKWVALSNAHVDQRLRRMNNLTNCN